MRPVRHDLDRLVVHPHQVDQLAVVAIADRQAERHRRVAGGAQLRLPDLLLADVQVAGDLRRGGIARQQVGQLDAGVPDFRGEVLHPPVHVDDPGLVPEVALDLAADGADGERGERAAVRVVPVHGLDQSQPGDLLEVVERLGAPAVAARSRGNQTVDERPGATWRKWTRLFGIR